MPKDNDGTVTGLCWVTGMPLGLGFPTETTRDLGTQVTFANSLLSRHRAQKHCVPPSCRSGTNAPKTVRQASPFACALHAHTFSSLESRLAEP